MNTATRIPTLLLAAAAGCAAPLAQGTPYFTFGELGTVSRTDTKTFLNMQPATWALCAGGLLGIGVLRRRQGQPATGHGHG
jgi:hypothetical protein